MNQRKRKRNRDLLSSWKIELLPNWKTQNKESFTSKFQNGIRQFSKKTIIHSNDFSCEKNAAEAGLADRLNKKRPLVTPPPLCKKEMMLEVAIPSVPIPPRKAKCKENDNLTVEVPLLSNSKAFKFPSTNEKRKKFADSTSTVVARKHKVGDVIMKLLHTLSDNPFKPTIQHQQTKLQTKQSNNKETKQNQVAKRPLGLKKNIKCVEHVRQDVDHTPSKSLTDGQLPAKTNQASSKYISPKSSYDKCSDQAESLDVTGSVSPNCDSPHDWSRILKIMEISNSYVQSLRDRDSDRSNRTSRDQDRTQNSDQWSSNRALGSTKENPSQVEDWLEYVSSSGKKYYYNWKSDVSQWKKPRGLEMDKQQEENYRDRYTRDRDDDRDPLKQNESIKHSNTTEVGKNLEAQRSARNTLNQISKKKNDQCVDPAPSESLIAQSPAITNQDSVKRTQKRPPTAIKSSSQNWNELVHLSSRSPHLSQSTVGVRREDKGKLIIWRNKMYRDIPFEPHQCGSACVDELSYTEASFKNDNPLTVPMKWGWSREVTKRYSPKGIRNVIYRGPCGRRLRNMNEVHQYLRLTHCALSVDLFCYELSVSCFREFQPDNVRNQIEDISNGKEERVLISCVNSIDTSLPEYVEYTTKRIPREGVDLNLDPKFLICCDCTDNCQDKENCVCWQLTLQSSGVQTNPNIGYEFRRLYDRVRTGVYECNSQCACRNNCLNRVAQMPIKLRLQVFRTGKKGWGIRCLDDIPIGEFICAYAGDVLTEQEANKDGTKYGDENLIDLKLIEECKNSKEGYESDVETASLHSSSDSESPTDTLDFQDSDASTKKIQKLSGVNEHCYVMDANTIGNVSRYFNHCCTPNVFAQNVFVDSHDLRFHCVSFFALNNIRAGKELTWDYGYKVGGVLGKKIKCHCGARNCRGRLL